MEYTQGYINCSRQQLIDALVQRLSTYRFEHVLRVEKIALELAEHYGAELAVQEACSIAALLHDYAKEMPLEELSKLAIAYWDYPNLAAQNNEILHGMAAAQIAKTTFACQDARVLAAIAGHTIGWYQMDFVAKVVYIADYIEPGRRFDKVETARTLAFQSLDEAVWFKMRQTLSHLIIDKKQPIFLGAMDIYNNWTTQGF
ncbi:MAG: bis(5'-nucleosyl)-tetraphosphatase (symmetrical) YqeK [Aerococcaceae bacterium]|nr:bis(5'-nucleosyl)-tetraphosphatase (symmetrical) YqeK [Aerococcaceae bacterium]